MIWFHLPPSPPIVVLILYMPVGKVLPVQSTQECARGHHPLEDMGSNVNLASRYIMGLELTVQMEGLVAEAFGKLNLSMMKKEQMDAIVGIMEQDIFCNIAYGMENALASRLILLYNELEHDPAIVVAVTPITSIMKDQVRVQY